MTILIKSFLNSKLDLIRTAKFFKRLFRIQIGGKELFWNKVKSKIEACYSELVLILKSNQKDFLPEEDGSLIAFFRELCLDFFTVFSFW